MLLWLLLIFVLKTLTTREEVWLLLLLLLFYSCDNFPVGPICDKSECRCFAGVNCDVSQINLTAIP